MNANLKSMSMGLVLTISAALCGPASAAPDTLIPREKVSYADLNLSRPEGAARLYRRIERAAAKVCVTFDGGHLSNRPRRRSCIEQAVARAVAAVGVPALTDHYIARANKDGAVRTAAQRL
jgi:UrcA family protein